MTRSNTAIFILLITVFTSSGAAQPVDTVEELKVCARMTDQDARFACLDNLGERVLREESAAKEPKSALVAQPDAAATTVAATNAPLGPGGLGDTTFRDEPASTIIKHSGLITSCKKGVYGNWFFFFDDGQVWMDVNKRIRGFKECTFNATITKGTFGHKLRIDGEEETIPVKRHR